MDKNQGPSGDRESHLKTDSTLQDETIKQYDENNHPRGHYDVGRRNVHEQYSKTSHVKKHLTDEKSAVKTRVENQKQKSNIPLSYPAKNKLTISTSTLSKMSITRKNSIQKRPPFKWLWNIMYDFPTYSVNVYRKTMILFCSQTLVWVEFKLRKLSFLRNWL